MASKIPGKTRRHLPFGHWLDRVPLEYVMVFEIKIRERERIEILYEGSRCRDQRSAAQRPDIVDSGRVLCGSDSPDKFGHRCFTITDTDKVCMAGARQWIEYRMNASPNDRDTRNITDRSRQFNRSGKMQGHQANADDVESTARHPLRDTASLRLRFGTIRLSQTEQNFRANPGVAA